MARGRGEERVFRGVAAALFVAMMAVAGYHRHRARRIGGSVSLAAEGAPMVVALRLSGLALWLAIVAYMVKPRSMRWAAVRLPTGLRWLGAGLGTAGLPLGVWVFRSLGTNVTPAVATRAEHTLVTSGPYRWVRHPLYTVGALFFGSLALVAANWFIGLMSVVALALLRLRLPKEEAALVERFGAEYRAYVTRTGRLRPRRGARGQGAGGRGQGSVRA